MVCDQECDKRSKHCVTYDVLWYMSRQRQVRLQELHLRSAGEDASAMGSGPPRSRRGRELDARIHRAVVFFCYITVVGRGGACCMTPGLSCEKRGA